MNTRANFKNSSLSKGNPRAIAVRVVSLSGGKVGGSVRHMLRVAPIPSYIDQGRCDRNSIIREPLYASDLRDICLERRAQREMKRKMKANAAVGFEGLIVFGHEAQKDFEALSVEEQDLAYLQVAEAIADRVNSTITGLVVHRDETAPHAHFQMPAYDLAGNPLNQTIKNDVTRDMQSIAAAVIKQHVATIERGNDKYVRLANGADYVDVTNKSVKQLHSEMRDEVQEATVHAEDLKKQCLDLEEKISKNTRYAEKWQEKAIECEKAEKRYRTYARRVASHEETLRSLQSAISELEAQEEALSEAQLRIEPVTAAIAEMDRFKAEQAVWEAFDGNDVFMIQSAEVRKVTRPRFNPLAPMADLGVEHVEISNFEVVDANGVSNRDWHYELPHELAAFLLQAFQKAVEVGRELWVQVTGWQNKIPTEVGVCDPPPTQPEIAAEVVELLKSLNQETIKHARGINGDLSR